jgi:hypothetical protein
VERVDRGDQGTDRWNSKANGSGLTAVFPNGLFFLTSVY